VLLINEEPRHKDASGSGGIAPTFLASSLDGSGELHEPGKEPPVPHFMGWVVPRAGLDAMEKRTIPASTKNRTPAVHSISRRYTESSWLML
jgi:hypothetical protein